MIDIENRWREKYYDKVQELVAVETLLEKKTKEAENYKKALIKIEEQDRMRYGGRPYHVIAREALEAIKVGQDEPEA